MILSTSTGLSTSTVTIRSTDSLMTWVTTLSTGTSFSTTWIFSTSIICGWQAARTGSALAAPNPARNERRVSLRETILSSIAEISSNLS